VWHGIGPAGADAQASRAAGAMSPAVTLQVTKKAGENAVDVARRVEKRVAELGNTVIPMASR